MTGIPGKNKNFPGKISWDPAFPGIKPYHRPYCQFFKHHRMFQGFVA